MQLDETALPGVVLLRPKRVEDVRGYTQKGLEAHDLTAAGLPAAFPHEIQSLARLPGTVRGLYAQAKPLAQDRLVRALAGDTLAVVVDARGGAHHGTWVRARLSASNGRQLFVPAGCFLGHLATVPGTSVLIKATAPFEEDLTQVVSHADTELGIDWGLPQSAIMATRRDAEAGSWRDWNTNTAAVAVPA